MLTMEQELWLKLGKAEEKRQDWQVTGTQNSNWKPHSIVASVHCTAVEQELWLRLSSDSSKQGQE